VRWNWDSSGVLHRLQERRGQLLWFGLVEALAVVAVPTVVFLWIGRAMGYPSPALLRSLAEIGVALLLAYTVEAVWLVNRAERKDWHENWLGAISGVGVAGLLGIAVALAAAAHREAGHGNLLDDIGLWWSVSAVGVLGIFVVLHPFAVDREITKDQRRSAGEL
jgi:hypothetical protein